MQPQVSEDVDVGVGPALRARQADRPTLFALGRRRLDLHGLDRPHRRDRLRRLGGFGSFGRLGGLGCRLLQAAPAGPRRSAATPRPTGHGPCRSSSPSPPQRSGLPRRTAHGVPEAPASPDAVVRLPGAAPVPRTGRACRAGREGQARRLAPLVRPGCRRHGSVIRPEPCRRRAPGRGHDRPLHRRTLERAAKYSARTPEPRRIGPTSAPVVRGPRARSAPSLRPG